MTGFDDLQRLIKDAPDLPGVYLFRDAAGEVLYVGKALSLRKRLANYLPAVRSDEAVRVPARVADMGARADTVEWIVTSTEVEAFLLESNLIKRHHPPFNIRLRDDKSYPYIAITMTDEYPRVLFTREPHRRGNLYFGPYTSAAKVRETLDILGRIFPFRKCRGSKPGRRNGSPCLQHFISRCDGPCDGLISPEDYRTQVIDRVVDFLSGRAREVARELEAEMKAAATAQQFERAALYRDRLEALRHVLEGQQATTSTLGNADIIGMALDDWGANVQVFVTRDGALADRRSFSLENTQGADPEEVFERFAAEYYAGAVQVPPEIIVPPVVTGVERLAAFLERLRGAKVVVRHAERGDKRRLRELADRNAALALQHERLREERTRERRYGALTGLQTALGLERPPLRIEGYDISNLGPEAIVASMVVFEGGVARKSDYRKFAIRDTDGQDDVGALREALTRRFTRGGDGEERPYDPSFEAVPDLVVVDGGKPQLGAALGVLEELGLDQVIPLISLAKREEEVFVPGRSGSLRLERDDPALLLLQRLRDEAHRFAVTFHRRRRSAQTTASIFDGLPGVGDKRKRALVQHFGSPERFLQASRDEIESVPGMPGKVARDVYAFVHKTG
jgi:excinuclease ABC subunit C